jgi:two-component system, OmpR family, sensor histidine kinase KdpD
MMNSEADGVRRVPALATYGTVILIVASCTLLNWLLARWLSLTDLAMIYLLGVVIAATYLPVGAAIVAAVVSLLSFDFFFVPPVLTLTFADKQHLITGLILLAVGIITSALAGEMRRQARAATQAAMLAREEQLRSSLLASISHDLRTPLAVIAGSASTLRENRDRLNKEEQDELLNTIFESARSMSVEINDVLEMTRLNAGPVKLNLQWYPLEELIGAALERCKEKLVNHRISVKAPADMPLVRVDGVLFEKLLVNLLENGAKHTPPRTHVSVVVARSSSAIEVRVEDDGPGLPFPTTERVFQKFERGSSEGATTGSGLGLAICQAIAQLHGISIVGRNRPARGAEFVVSMPHTLEVGPGAEDE